MENKWSLEASSGCSSPTVDVRWSKWTLMDNKVYLDLFSSPLLRSLTIFHVFLCVVAWLQPSSEYGIFSSQLLCLHTFFWLLCVLCVDIICQKMPGQFFTECGKRSSTLSHLIRPAAGNWSWISFAFHCSLVDIHTPAVLISIMAISAGRAVISDNSGHFLRLSQLEVMMNQAHYGGHMWLCAGSDGAFSLWLMQTFIN